MPSRSGRLCLASCLSIALLSAAGCSRQDGPAHTDRNGTTLTIGFGSTTGTRIQQVADLITQEGLINLGPDGRPISWLAKSWSVADDGLTWRFVLKDGVTFHNGTPLTAAIVRDVLTTQLPANLGSAASDIDSIESPSSSELVIKINHRSTFLPEALSVLIHPDNSGVGTGPFYVSTTGGSNLELRANDKYVEGKPQIDRIVIQPYTSVRTAWAELLRANVDMIYEVGLDALELVSSATETKIFNFQRPYAYAVLLNMQRPSLKKAAIRQALNQAINRQQFVSEALGGHGRPADGPVWPDHWTNDGHLPKFSYAPSDLSAQHLSLTCLYSDPAYERMALFVQQQLRAAGIDVRLELTTVDEGLARVSKGDFDAWLADVGIGPGFLRQNLFWHSGGPFNWGRYSNPRVDEALDAIRYAADESQYRIAVAAFQSAMVDDPPAIFLAWSERARAVSARFDVYQEPGRDILNTLRLWRPAAVERVAHN